MKARTQAFADKLLNDPSISQTQAYLDTHETNNRRTANSNATQLLNQPNVMEYMASKSDTAEKAIVNVMQNAKKNKESVQWQRLAMDSATTILDRVHGKPLTKTSSLNVNVSIESALNSLE